MQIITTPTYRSKSGKIFTDLTTALEDEAFTYLSNMVNSDSDGEEILRDLASRWSDLFGMLRILDETRTSAQTLSKDPIG